jgi:hypothetical protein
VNIIVLVIVLAVVGFLLYLLLTYVPMPRPFPQLIVGIVVFAIILWLLSAFGLLGGGPTFRLR